MNKRISALCFSVLLASTVMIRAGKTPICDSGASDQSSVREAIDEEGFLPIHQMVDEGRLDIVKVLLARNKDYAVAPYRKGEHTYYPLEFYGASQTPVDAIADELCKAGASAKQVNLMVVLWNTNTKNADQVFNKLRALGVSTCAADKNGQTPLMIALQKGYERIASTLITEQDSPTLVDNQGATLLHYAALGGMHRLLKPITERYAISVNAVDNEDIGGDTPLHIAVRPWKEDTVAVLRSLGAQDIKNKQGQTPRDLVLETLSFIATQTRDGKVSVDIRRKDDAARRRDHARDSIAARRRDDAGGSMIRPWDGSDDDSDDDN
jgi:ankyrin repeat protein